MNLFKSTKENPFNIGDKFTMIVELLEITKDADKIRYKVRPLFIKNPSSIYGLDIEDINKLEIIKEN